MCYGVVLVTSLLSILSHSTHDHYLGVTLHTVSWSLPGKLLTKNMHPQANLLCEFFQFRFHFSQITLA